MVPISSVQVKIHLSGPSAFCKVYCDVGGSLNEQCWDLQVGYLKIVEIGYTFRALGHI